MELRSVRTMVGAGIVIVFVFESCCRMMDLRLMLMVEIVTKIAWMEKQ